MGLGFYTTAYAATFHWQSAANAPINRVEGAAAVVGGKFYVFGGFVDSNLNATNRVDVYNPANNTWSQLANMPVAETHFTPAVDGNVVWVAGGFVGQNPGPATNSVWKYDVTANSWTAGPALPAARGGGALVVVGRTLHYFGGYLPDRQTDSTNHWVLFLDNVTSWSNALAMPDARGHFTAQVVSGKIYVFGGAHGHDISSIDTARVDMFDPIANTWTRLPDMLAPRSHAELSSFVLNERVLMIGGRNNAASINAMPNVSEFDPTSNTWTELPPLPVNLVSCAGKVVGSKVIVAHGGQNYNNLPVNATRTGVLEEFWATGPAMPTPYSEIAGGIISNKLYILGFATNATATFNLAATNWSFASARPYPYDHHCADVYNGKLFVLGAQNDNGWGKVQIYNPSSDTWTTGATAPFLFGAAASALINGEIYVAGGLVTWSPNDKHAKYNPTSNTWTMLAKMPKAAHHTAGGTDGRKFYVFGGRAGSAGTIEDGFNTVQVYDPATDIWRSSDNTNSGIAPMPIGRSGVAKAPYYNGEFYLIGGETLTSPGATNGVFSRVDIYNPGLNTWRAGTPMPTARYAISPLLASGRIYVVSGSTHSGYGTSTIFEYYQPGALGDFLTALTLSNGNAHLRFPSATGKTYNIDARPNFGTGWQTLTTVSGTGDFIETTTPATAPIQFHRVSRSP
ncbi:MAG: Kelch repeat-containing protein [Verrucomicrobiales bacterium]|nr:Kelch repeat-containing protein [Verrucomicrobiales bacterium]